MKPDKTTTVKKNLNQIAAFRVEAQKYEKANPKPTKSLYAITRMLSRIDNAKPFAKYEERLNEVNQEIADIQVEHQATNEDGHLLYEDEACTIKKFTPEKEKACRKKVVDVNAKWGKELEKIFEKEIELEPFMIEDKIFLKALNFKQIDAFRGFVIPEDFEPIFE